MANEELSLGELLIAERKRRRWTQARLSEEIGLVQQAVSDLERGFSGSTERWREVAKFLGLPEEKVQALMLAARRKAGKTTRLPRPVERQSDRSAPFIAQPEGGMVPILGQAIGGDDGRMVFNGAIAGYVARPHDLAGVPDAYAIYVAGDSMEPRYRQGETVWVHPHKPPHMGSDVVVQLHGGDEDAAPTGFIKEYRGIAGTKLVLRQYNPAKDIKVERSEVVSVHTVVLAERR